VAVNGSAEMVAGWEQAVGRDAQAVSGPSRPPLRAARSATGSDFLKAADKAPTLLFIHGGYWQARGQGGFHHRGRRADGARHSMSR